MATSSLNGRVLLLATAVVACGCASARPSPTRTTHLDSTAAAKPLAPHSDGVALPRQGEPDAEAQEAQGEAGALHQSGDVAAIDAAVDAGSTLATLFDGDPTGGPVHLAEARCGPGCLQYPTGWIATDDSGFVYAWFYRGEGQFGTAEVARCPVAQLDDAALAFRLACAGGENVTWSTPLEGTVGKDHAHALIAEGAGTSHGRPAHFWYAYVDVAHRKDLVIGYVVDGEPQERNDQVIAVMRSVRLSDGSVASSP